MTRVGICSRTNDTHETGPPKSETYPKTARLDEYHLGSGKMERESGVRILIGGVLRSN